MSRDGGQTGALPGVPQLGTTIEGGGAYQGTVPVELHVGYLAVMAAEH